VWELPQVDIHAAPDCYVFTRGSTVVVTTNVGSGRSTVCTFTVPPGAAAPVGGRFVNILEPTAAEVTMDPESRRVTVNVANGSPLVLQAVQASSGSGGGREKGGGEWAALDPFAVSAARRRGGGAAAGAAARWLVGSVAAAAAAGWLA
jgi:hypothetical protein